jgi:hypothetical protein
MKVYQLKISLMGIKPPVWRRVLVPSGINFLDLHRIIQTVMGWCDCHLFEFNIGNRQISLDDDSGIGDPPDFEADKTKINKYFEKGLKFKYIYDFGDYWRHNIIVEDIYEGDKDEQYPLCIKGKRQCPPEDIGGEYGYENFLEAIADPKHEDYDQMVEWVGEDYDPEEFSVEDINFMLNEL